MLSSGTVFRVDLELISNEEDVDNARFKRLLAENKTEPKMPFYVLPGGRAIGRLQDSTVVHVAATDPQFHRRWAMAWQFQQLYPMVFDTLPIRQGDFARGFWLADSFPGSSTKYDVRLVPRRHCESWFCYTPLAGESISNHDVTLTDLDERTSFVILSLSALAYGGLHGSAWRDNFPTSTELLLWRISSVYMAASRRRFSRRQYMDSEPTIEKVDRDYAQRESGVEAAIFLFQTHESSFRVPRQSVGGFYCDASCFFDIALLPWIPPCPSLPSRRGVSCSAGTALIGLQHAGLDAAFSPSLDNFKYPTNQSSAVAIFLFKSSLSAHPSG